MKLDASILTWLSQCSWCRSYAWNVIHPSKLLSHLTGHFSGILQDVAVAMTISNKDAFARSVQAPKHIFGVWCVRSSIPILELTLSLTIRDEVTFALCSSLFFAVEFAISPGSMMQIEYDWATIPRFQEFISWTLEIGRESICERRWMLCLRCRAFGSWRGYNMMSDPPIFWRIFRF